MLREKILLILLVGVISSGCVAPVDRSSEIHRIEVQNRAIAFTHVNVVPMTQETVLTDQTLVVKDDRIVAIGDSEQVVIPADATVIDAAGAYLMPGLADMHVHIYEESIEEYPMSPLNLYVANGVTTIRDCGTAPLGPSDTFVLDWRDSILAGEMIGPMIYSSGRTIHGPVVNPARVVQERYENGFDFVKLYVELSIDEFDQAQSAAEELNMYSVGHIPYQVGFERVITAGLDEIAHLEELTFELVWSAHRPVHYQTVEQWTRGMIQNYKDDFGELQGDPFSFDQSAFDRVKGDQLDQMLSELLVNDIAVGTSLAVYEVVDQKLFKREEFLKRTENIYLPPSLIESLVNGQDRHVFLYQLLGDDAWLWQWKRGVDGLLLHRLHQAGVLLVAGSDSGSSSIGVVEGFSMHDELRILTEHGFTPYEAIQTATVNAAEVVGRMKGMADFGTIEPGMRADMIMIAGNPLENINNTRSILGVMARGNWYPEEQLSAMIAIGK